jgi:predicted component of type VI protein secretion system
MRVSATLLLLALLLAGCASHTSENVPGNATTTPPGGTPVSTTPTPSANATNGTGEAAFVLAGPTLRFPNGTTSTVFHEDDDVVAHYELSLTPNAPSDHTALAALLVNGNVIDVETVHLQPGQTKAFDAPVSLANATRLLVQVNVGAARGETNATIVRWPRLSQTFPLGAASVTMTHEANASDGVHVRLSIWTPADGNVTALRVALLCPDARGHLTAQGDQQAPLTPGVAVDDGLDFAPCNAPYGLALVATDALGDHAGRVLFGA